MKTLTVLLIFILAGNSLGAQKINHPIEITLEQAIKIAKSNNTLLKNALLDVEASEALQKTSINLPATSIESNFGQINSTADDYWIQISQSFHWPGVYVSRKKLISMETDLKRIQYQISENNLLFEVMDAYNKWLFYHENFEILRKHDSLHNEYRKFSELQYEKGDIDYLSKLTALTKANEVRHQMIEIENDIKIAHKILQQVLNSDKEYIPAEKRMKKFMTFSVPDSIYTELNPWLRYADKKTEYHEAEVKLQKKEWFPDFSAGYFNQSVDEKVGYDGWYFGLNLPIWFWNQKGNIQYARIKKEIADNEYEVLHYQMQLEIEKLNENVNKYTQSLEHYENTMLIQAELLIESSDKSLKAGEIGNTEYILISSKAFEIEQKYNELLFEYNRAVLELNRYLVNPH